jgi:hypothetical protein
MKRLRILALTLAAAAACGTDASEPESAGTMDAVAESYVRLVLALGEHDTDYVDAFYGPAEWREQVAEEALGLPDIGVQADELLERLESIEPGEDEMVRLRHSYLTTQLGALAARVAMLSGRTLTFDEESRALYDAEAPTNSNEHFAAILEAMDDVLPGDGSLSERYGAFRSRFVIPSDLLDTVFSAAIDACRQRTLQYMELPEGESFVVEYVTDKSWSGYNWYQGGYQSLIQVNTDLPIFIDRAVDLACHEGYPGHHTYNAMLESHLVDGRGWPEFSVYPLFSPQSFIAEGSANFGTDMAFPGDERIEFERDVLFPLAGLDPATATDYYRVQELAGQLSYAGNEAARQYLNGDIDVDGAVAWLQQYAMYSPQGARQRMRFVDQYRSYVINYNLGQDLVRAFVDGNGEPGSRDDRWARFIQLLASPRLPSDL